MRRRYYLIREHCAFLDMKDSSNEKKGLEEEARNITKDQTLLDSPTYQNALWTKSDVPIQTFDLMSNKSDIRDFMSSIGSDLPHCSLNQDNTMLDMGSEHPTSQTVRLMSECLTCLRAEKRATGPCSFLHLPTSSGLYYIFRTPSQI